MTSSAAARLKFIAERFVYEGYLRVKEFVLQFQRFDQQWSAPLTREVLTRGEAVVVLPYDPVARQVLLIEQFRLPAWVQGFDPWLLELPAGMLDDGETPEAVAMREMREETGLAITGLRLLHSFLPTPGVLAETIHLFFAQCDLSPLRNGHALFHGKTDEGEDIRLIPTDLVALPALLASGKIVNATALLGLYWLLREQEVK